MKKAFFLVFAFFAIASAHAQTVNPDTIQVTVSLPTKIHGYLIGFMGDRGQSERINYLNQVAEQYDPTDLNKVITVTVPGSLVRDLWLAVGSQPQRLTGTTNELIKKDLLVQLQKYPLVLKMIGQALTASELQLEAIIQEGLNFVQAIKQQ